MRRRFFSEKTINNNTIIYTSIDNSIINPTCMDFGSPLLQNTVINGLGKMCFLGNVTKIGYHAFYGRDNLASITIPDSVTTIGDSAFDGCISLASITIGNGVTSIGSFAFSSCRSLTSVTIPDGLTTIGAYTFQDCNSLTSITIPDSVTSIRSSTFQYCTSLTSITIPDNVTEIGENAFSGCRSLTSVTIPDKVTSIGNLAFRGCDSLISITIPDSVKTIGNYAFKYSDSLTSVTIGDSVTSIGYGAFSDCTSLKDFYCKATIPPTGNDSMFDNNASGRKIYVPSNSVAAYKSAQYWSGYANDIIGYDFNDGEDSVNLITFYLGNIEYQAEDGMTFGQWMLSEYYVLGTFRNDTDYINAIEINPSFESELYNGGGYTIGLSYNPKITTQSVIIANTTYIIDMSGSSN